MILLPHCHFEIAGYMKEPKQLNNLQLTIVCDYRSFTYVGTHAAAVVFPGTPYGDAPAAKGP